MTNLRNISSSHDFLPELLKGENTLLWDKGELVGGVTPEFGTALEMAASQIDDIANRTMTVGLIDCYRFSQECLIKALENLQCQLTVFPFTTVEGCIAEGRTDLDLIIYYSHANGAADTTPIQNVSAVGKAFPTVPLVILSDVDDAQQIKTIRSTLKNGAHGFIPTRTTGIPITIAAIRLVKAGGIFAPMDLVLANRADQPAATPEASRQNPLTSRQMAVLGHMQRGSANKIIAHELGMSESTVKVHVRNIMRKVGATNRTQAVYKTRMLLESLGTAMVSDR